MNAFEQENPHNTPEMSALFRGERGEPGPKGDKGEPGASDLNSIAGELGKLIKAKASPKWWSAALTAVISLVIVGGVILGIVVNTIHNNQDTIRVQQHQIQSQAAQIKQETQALKAETQALKLYTDTKARNACDALNLLTAVPVPKPNAPLANPSREATYRFYVALNTWAIKDGCKSSRKGVYFGPPPSR